MKRLCIWLVVTPAVVAALLVGSSVVAHDRDNEFDARLHGYNEVPAVSSRGSGDFSARINDTTIDYRLRYGGLEGVPAQAHIHLGQKDVNGGVSAFLCGGGDKPPCPTSGTVSGVIDAADVIGPTGQGIAPGEIDELIRAVRAGVTYVNVHTDKHPGGEIRGQVGADDGRGRDNHGRGGKD